MCCDSGQAVGTVLLLPIEAEIFMAHCVGLNFKRSLLVGSIALTLCNFATAQPSRLDCASWLKRDASKAVLESWLMGYMTGLRDMWSAQNRKPVNPLSQLNSTDQAVLWVDNYCKANPLDGPDLAGMKLFFELATKAKSKAP